MGRVSKTGFSLLELAVVAAIVGIIAALAIPAYMNVVRASRFTALSNDLRVHSEAILTHVADTGDYPSTHKQVGKFIPGMEGALSGSWLEETPVGGAYTWVYTQQSNLKRRRAFIQIVRRNKYPFKITLSELVDLDEKIDDGNLAQGHLQVAGNRIRYFVKLREN
jgi:prepilin-type N-terminal cleavage/methylation domain-containing protein